MNGTLRIVSLMALGCLLFSGPAARSQSRTRTSATKSPTGISWRIVSFSDTTFKGMPFEKMGIMLRKDGRLTGFAICNTLSGRYTLNRSYNRLGLSALSLTWRGCGDKTGVEYYFLNALKTVTTYKLSGKTLLLYSKNRKVMTLER